ncbi:MAG: hypothetical protein J6O00_10455 [Clostridiales bacterium]|nr:hypothetical protein [Clostridiales bacterium]
MKDEPYIEISIPLLSKIQYPDTEELKTTLRKTSRHKAFEVFVAVGLIISIGVFGLLLQYPATGLAELAKDNSDLKDEIALLKRNTLDLTKTTVAVTDMDAIRAQALELGMQDPNENQIVYLPLPETDRLETIAFGEITEEQYQAAVNAIIAYNSNK